jgi:hypothetical protein
MSRIFQPDRKSSSPSRRCSVTSVPRSGLLDGLERVLAGALGFPADAVLGGQSGAAGGQRHAVGDDERRVEPDAELADQVGVLRLVAGERLEELARARLRDRADVADHFLPRHADAVVGDRDGPGGLVVRDPDLQLAVVLVQRLVGQRLEAQLVGRRRTRWKPARAGRSPCCCRASGSSGRAAA